ncbi:hypothetical protein [Brachybacterium vulturis]|uniref:hypothetical protein n=1 Tax=Brachybacterium vulturis TaxID=2017484 RepID=UPI003736992E
MKVSAKSSSLASQRSPEKKQRAQVFLYALVAIALTVAIPLLARPAFHYSPGGNNRPNGLLIVNSASDDYNSTTWIQSMEPWEINSSVSVGFTTQFQVPAVTDEAGNVIAPPASEADQIEVSYLLVDSLANGITGCSEHVNGAMEDDIIAFDDLRTEEREVVTSWIGNHSTPPGYADAEDTGTENAKAARKLTFRRLTPTNPNPTVLEYESGNKVSVVRFESTCNFASEAFWHDVGNTEAFTFPHVYSMYESSRSGESRQWAFRNLKFKHDINSQHDLADSTVQPEFRDEGYAFFLSESEAGGGDYAILSPFEVAYTDTQEEKIEGAMLFLAGILAGLLSSIILKGIEVCIKKVSE